MRGGDDAWEFFLGWEFWEWVKGDLSAHEFIKKAAEKVIRATLMKLEILFYLYSRD